VRSATRARAPKHALQGTDGHRSRRQERRQLLWGNARDQTPCASDDNLPLRRRLAQKTENDSAACDQTIVDYHGSRPGKVSARDFQPISLLLVRTTTSPPPSLTFLMTQQAGNALEKGSDVRRRPLACAGEPWLFASPTRFSQCPSPLRVEKHIVAWSAMYSPSRTARKTPQVAIVTRQLQHVKGQIRPISIIWCLYAGLVHWPSILYYMYD
jgi:hypothetical protein